MNDLGLGRFVGLMAAFLGQWLGRGTAGRLAVIFTFTMLAVAGLWIGANLARLVDDPALSRDVAACGLYMVTGVVFWRLLRARG